MDVRISVKISMPAPTIQAISHLRSLKKRSKDSYLLRLFLILYFKPCHRNESQSENRKAFVHLNFPSYMALIVLVTVLNVERYKNLFEPFSQGYYFIITNPPPPPPLPICNIMVLFSSNTKLTCDVFMRHDIKMPHIIN